MMVGVTLQQIALAIPVRAPHGREDINSEIRFGLEEWEEWGIKRMRRELIENSSQVGIDPVWGSHYAQTIMTHWTGKISQQTGSGVKSKTQLGAIPLAQPTTPEQIKEEERCWFLVESEAKELSLGTESP